jgi:hypothetical protein
MHWIVSRILLIALAIQGITADAYDLTSINAVRLLFLVPADFDFLDDGDEWPDDVCEAPVAEMNCLAREKAERDSAPACNFRWHKDSVTMPEMSAVRIETNSGPFPMGPRLIRALCRLLC